MPTDVPKKRNRQIVSCLNCRKKKRKCDRLLPCSNCTKYKLLDSCSYAASPSGSSPPYSSLANGRNGTNGVSRPAVWPTVNNELERLKNRIKEIESTVAIAASGVLPSHSQEYRPSVEIMNSVNENNNLGDAEETYIGINPLGSSTDALSFHCDFHENYLFLSHRPLRLLGFMRKDPGAKLFWNYRGNMMPKSLILKVILDENRERNATLREGASKFYGDAYIPPIDQPADINVIKKAISNYSPRHLLWFKNSNEEMRLYDRLKIQLPNEDVLWKYVLYFFANLYQFFPLIDENEFKSEISRIVIYSNGTVDTLVIDKRQNLAILATLLIILRLTFFSVLKNEFPDGESTNNNDVIPVDNLQVAEQCLKEFDITRKQNLCVLQALIFLRIYRVYGPEEGDGILGSDIQAFHGTLVQLAYSLGLNRDPIAYVDLKSNEKVQHLRRKIWHYLVVEDVLGSAQFGTTLSTHFLSYDTKVPFFNGQNSNVVNQEVEREAVANMAAFNSFYAPVVKIVEIMSNVKTSIQITELVEHITELEIVCSKLSGVSSIAQTSDAIESILIIRMRIYLHSKIFLQFIYYCLFLYFDNKGDYQLSFFYFRKLMLIMFKDLMAFMNDVWMPYCNTNGLLMLILTPSMETYFYMIIILSLIMMVRLKSTLYTLKKSEGFTERYNNDAGLKEFVLCLEEITKIISRYSKFQKEVFELSIYYYHAWKIRKLDLLFMKSVGSEEIYSTNMKLTNLAVLNFSTEMLQELLALFKVSCDEKVEEGLESKSEDEIMKLIQLDNMWVQFNSISRDQESVPPYCRDERANQGEIIDQATLSAWSNDFNFFDDVCFDELNSYEIFP
ncbi:uncharacterized protein PRCAT00004484001 [Priceomyces carsonii]|uniref:uncharacterized protein n=1 Tax=Priceomyces carsonii TaxID=28549 RepID=UPI002ED89F00|nr:unnamed protein product [Priceomyces carsonii]